MLQAKMQQVQAKGIQQYVCWYRPTIADVLLAKHEAADAPDRITVPRCELNERVRNRASQNTVVGWQRVIVSSLTCYPFKLHRNTRGHRRQQKTERRLLTYLQVTPHKLVRHGVGLPARFIFQTCSLDFTDEIWRASISSQTTGHASPIVCDSQSITLSIHYTLS